MKMCDIENSVNGTTITRVTNMILTEYDKDGNAKEPLYLTNL